MQTVKEMLQEIITTIESNGGYKAYYMREGVDEITAENLERLLQDAIRTGNTGNFCREAGKVFRNLPESAEKKGVFLHELEAQGE